MQIHIMYKIYYIIYHFKMHAFITNNTIFPNLFSASFKLRFYERNHFIIIS